MRRFRLSLAAVAALAAALALVPLAAADDASLKAAVTSAFTQLLGQQATLTSLQKATAPGIPAAKLKAYAKTAGASGAKLSALGVAAVAAVGGIDTSSPAGATAKATCMKLFTGVRDGGKLLVSWAKAEQAGKAKPRDLAKLRTFAGGLVSVALTCQTQAASLQ